MKSSNTLILLLLVSLTGCAGAHFDSTNYPKSREDMELERVGKITGDEGIVLVGDKKKSRSSQSSIGVNSYLWRATLDTVHSMPVTTIDPFGGVIMTDWYSTAPHPNERFKLNIFILGSELRSDALRVSAFHQIRRGKEWIDQEPTSKLADEVEEKILLRARAFKVRDQK